MKLVTTTIFLILLTGMTLPSHAQTQQNRESRTAEEFQKISEIVGNFSRELINIPAGIGRIAVLSLQNPDERVRSYGMELIRNRMERSINEQAGLQAVTMPQDLIADELELSIEADEDNLVINNVSSAEFANETDRLLWLAQEYNIDGYMTGTVHYVDGEFILNVHLFRPRSREVVWSETFSSSDFEIREPRDTKYGLFTIGTSVLGFDTYRSGGAEFSDDLQFLNYSAEIGIRSSINSANSSFLGVTAAVHHGMLIKLDDQPSGYGSFSVQYLQLGFRFYQALAEKERSIKDHWIDLFFGGSILLPVEPNNLFSLNQGISFNVTSTLALMLRADYLISPNPSFETEDEGKALDLNNLSYGLHILFRF